MELLSMLLHWRKFGSWWLLFQELIRLSGSIDEYLTHKPRAIRERCPREMTRNVLAILDPSLSHPRLVLVSSSSRISSPPIRTHFDRNKAFGLSILGMPTPYFNLGGELTYPAPENLSAALLLLAMNIVGLIITEIYKTIDLHAGMIWSAVFLVGNLVVGLILLIFTKEDLKRSKQNNSSMVEENKISQKWILEPTIL